MASLLQPRNPSQLNKILDQWVAAALKPQRREFANRRRRTVELAKALADLQRDIGPATGEAYQSAARTQGALAEGFTGELRADAAADAAAAEESLRRIGAPEAQIGQVRSVGEGAADHAYFLGGYTPGQSLSREGASLAGAQNQLPATTLGRGQYDVMAIDREEGELDEGIPKLRQEFRNQLIQEEITKAELELRNRAQALYEAQYGETVRSHKVDEVQAKRNYELQVKKHKLDLREAAEKGQKPNAALSKTYGYIVDGDGNPILDGNGRRIPVAKSKKGGGLTPKEQRQIRAEAIETARDLYGEPIPADELEGEGRFTAQPGKSEFKDGTTNKPKNAMRDTEYTFAEATNFLVTTYGIPKAKARRFLIAAGWPPPKPKKTYTPGQKRPG